MFIEILAILLIIIVLIASLTTYILAKPMEWWVGKVGDDYVRAKRENENRRNY